jgi:hypothetical protein
LAPKISYYASLFVVANARKPDIGEDILAYSIAKLKELLEGGDIVKAKYVLRFLAGLARIVENDDGFMAIITEIVNQIKDQTPNVFALNST